MKQTQSPTTKKEGADAVQQPNEAEKSRTDVSPPKQQTIKHSPKTTAPTAATHEEEIEDYVCLAISNQDTLNSMFDAIKDFVQEVNIKFTAEGMEIVNQDSTGVVVVLVQLLLPNIVRAGGLYEYKTAVSSVEVCLNVKLISTTLKSAVSQGDIVEIRILASEPNFVNIIERNVNTRKCIKTKVRVIKSDNEQTDDYVNKLRYDSCITMESVEFYDNIKKLSITESSTMRLWCDGNVLSFSSVGQFSNIMLNVELQKSEDAMRLANAAAAQKVKQERMKRAQLSSQSDTAQPSLSSSSFLPAADVVSNLTDAAQQQQQQPQIKKEPGDDNTQDRRIDESSTTTITAATTEQPRQEQTECEQQLKPFIEASVMTVDPMQSTSLEKRFSCIKRGSALYCRKTDGSEQQKQQQQEVTDEDYPLSFLMRIAKSKAVSKYISILGSSTFPIVTLSFDTEIGSLRFILASKEKNKEMRAVCATPKYVLDPLSVRVDEACKEKCNSIKRKRTRRVWSRKEAMTTNTSVTTSSSCVAAPRRSGGASKRAPAKKRTTTATNGGRGKTASRNKKTKEETKEERGQTTNNVVKTEPMDVTTDATTTVKTEPNEGGVDQPAPMNVPKQPRGRRGTSAASSSGVIRKRKSASDSLVKREPADEDDQAKEAPKKRRRYTKKRAVTADASDLADTLRTIPDGASSSVVVVKQEPMSEDEKTSESQHQKRHHRHHHTHRHRKNKCDSAESSEEEKDNDSAIVAAALTFVPVSEETTGGKRQRQSKQQQRQAMIAVKKGMPVTDFANSFVDDADCVAGNEAGTSSGTSGTPKTKMKKRSPKLPSNEENLRKLNLLLSGAISPRSSRGLEKNATTFTSSSSSSVVAIKDESDLSPTALFDAMSFSTTTTSNGGETCSDESFEDDEDEDEEKGQDDDSDDDEEIESYLNDMLGDDGDQHQQQHQQPTATEPPQEKAT